MSTPDRISSRTLFLASLVAENNSYSPVPTGYRAFEAEGLRRGGDRTVNPFGLGPAIDAASDEARRLGWDVVEGLCAAASPLGLVSRQAWDALRIEILDDLRKAMPVDAVVLLLHGAMMADGCDDCEGELLARVRQVVCADVPIGVQLDLHCHLSELMVRNADVILTYKEYPHIDIPERATQLVRLVDATARGHVVPMIGVFDTRMVASTWSTMTQPLRGFVDRLIEMEGKDGILCISLVHGFEFGDSPDAGTKLCVVSDANQQKADKLAAELGQELWNLRERLKPSLISVDEALDQAERLAFTPIVLTDPADNPGGGALGDSTFILERLVARKVRNAAIGGIWDPGAVQLCRDAGEGARMNLRIGGKGGNFSGAPVGVAVEIMAYRANHTQTGLGSTTPLGPSAWVRTDEGLDIVLISMRDQVLGTDLFEGLGIKLNDKRIIVVKSMQHFRDAFQNIAKFIIEVDTPGLLTAEIAGLPSLKRNRNVWPIVEDPFAASGT